MNSIERHKNYEILKEVLKLSIDIFKEIREFLNTKKYAIYHERIFYSFFKRNCMNLKAINKLLEEFYIDTNMKFPILIVCRNGILDFMTISYLLKFHNDDKKFKTEVNKLEIKLAKLLYKPLESEHFTEITEKEKNEIYSLLKKLFPDLWDDKKRKIKEVSLNTLEPSTMAKVFNEDYLKDYFWVYGLYQVLSIYEHFCPFSETLMHPDYDEDAFDKIMISISLILAGTIFICNAYNMKSYSEKLIDYRLKLDEIKINKFP